MRTRKSLLFRIIGGGILATILLSGCTQQSGSATNNSLKSPSKTYAEEELGLRKVTIYSESTVTTPGAEYSKDMAGSGKKFDRAFENAPPMIPHDLEGLVPITRDNNSCLSCHTREIAPSVGATAIPNSHYMNFRTQAKLEDVSMARFNCTQCHAPQAETPVAVINEFQPDFRNTKDMANSNLADKLNEGVR